MYATEMYNKFEEIRMAIQAYHTSLDNREHGDVAQDKCIHAIENILDMPWNAPQPAVQADGIKQCECGGYIDLNGVHQPCRAISHL